MVSSKVGVKKRAVVKKKAKAKTKDSGVYTSQDVVSSLFRLISLNVKYIAIFLLGLWLGLVLSIGKISDNPVFCLFSCSYNNESHYPIETKAIDAYIRQQKGG